jgi:FkbM family methyltransferase
MSVINRRRIKTTIITSLNWILKDSDNQYEKIAYSQEGEDMVLSRIFEGSRNGLYIDVGAHHPLRYSNTYFFYKIGWQGINIDAMPGSMALFSKLRPRDINLEIAVSDRNEDKTYFILNEPALNTFSEDLANEYCQSGDYRILQKKKISTRTLGDILNEHLNESTEIDFLSIDVEGCDFQVLRSNDWSRFRPKIVLVEYLDNNFDEFGNSDMKTFMKENGYDFFAKTINTVFFKRL